MTDLELILGASVVAILSYRFGSNVAAYRIARGMMQKPSGLFQRLDMRESQKRADKQARTLGYETMAKRVQADRDKLAKVLNTQGKKPKQDVPGGQYL